MAESTHKAPRVMLLVPQYIGGTNDAIDHAQPADSPSPAPTWNKGKLVGSKPPFKLQEAWSIRIRLEIEHRVRELALFNLAIDSKLRGCDLIRIKVSDVLHGRHAVSRAMVVQHKTRQPVRYELTEQTRDVVEAWIARWRGADGV